MGIAASLAVGDKWWWETQAFTLRRLTGELTAITRKGIALSLMSMDKVAVGDWLMANKAPRLTVLPAKLNELPAYVELGNNANAFTGGLRLWDK